MSVRRALSFTVRFSKLLTFSICQQEVTRRYVQMREVIRDSPESNLCTCPARSMYPTSRTSFSFEAIRVYYYHLSFLDAMKYYSSCKRTPPYAVS